MYLCDFIFQLCHYFLVTMFSTNVVFLGHTWRKSSELPKCQNESVLLREACSSLSQSSKKEDRNLIKLQFTLLPLCDEKV